MTKKYKTLVNILDQIRNSAPDQYKNYKPNDNNQDLINTARSKAYIHLFLKVRFGILKFLDREHFITEGSQDGGIDAYYINSESKVIYIIQSKFRNNSSNFEEKEISIEELLKMDIERILKGENKQENGIEYNGKILQFQREISNIPDIARYSYKVIILANLNKISDENLKKIISGFPSEIFNFDRTYKELLFPIVSGTYFNETELTIKLNLKNTNSNLNRIGYSVNTSFKECEITLVFAPTEEIGKILYKYKNSILKFNPRSYLELSKNSVNNDIAESIRSLETNEFALFNNGITFLSDETAFNEKVGKRDLAQIILTNPQIINGGQTAYTLSRLYEDVTVDKLPKDVFDGKEVLLKIITFIKEENDDEDIRRLLIESISRATNSQSPVNNADRRSNDEIQISIQEEIFNKFGLYYERKRGEFADGLRDGYISEDEIIDRETFLRVALACKFEVSKAKRNSMDQIFTEDQLKKLIPDIKEIPLFIFGYYCYLHLEKISSQLGNNINDIYGNAKYGQGIRYGKYAIISACALVIEKIQTNKSEQLVERILDYWLGFEKSIIEKIENNLYFKKQEKKKLVLDYANYYKGKTVNTDINQYFSKLKEEINSKLNS